MTPCEVISNQRPSVLSTDQIQCFNDSYLVAAMETPVTHDVYGQLAQKERDLLLAAQLGKALLEKNEELSMQNEKIAEEYSRQLEVTTPLSPSHVLRCLFNFYLTYSTEWGFFCQETIFSNVNPT